MAHDSPESVAPDDDTLAPRVVGGVVMLLTFVAGFGLMALGWPYFWIAFPIGFGGVLPTAVALAKWFSRTDTEETTEQEDALEHLRERYARGEIDEAEFERRVERLLETESVDRAETTYAGQGDRTAEPLDHDRDRQRDREREREQA